jgi:hypothetical protein
MPLSNLFCRQKGKKTAALFQKGGGFSINAADISAH